MQQAALLTTLLQPLPLLQVARPYCHPRYCHPFCVTSTPATTPLLRGPLTAVPPLLTPLTRPPLLSPPPLAVASRGCDRSGLTNVSLTRLYGSSCTSKGRGAHNTPE
eukprot:1185403-Prorocentrum_minimum.AAC.1